MLCCCCRSQAKELDVLCESSLTQSTECLRTLLEIDHLAMGLLPQVAGLGAREGLHSS